MGWSSKYKSQGKSNTSPGKHHTDHTLLQCFISLIVLLYSHSCSKLQKKRTPWIWEKGVQLRKLGQSHQANSRLSRHTDTFSIAYHRCSLHWKWVFVARQRNMSTCFFCETHGTTIPPWCFLEEKSGFGFHFWRHEIHPLRISGVSPTKNPRIGASRSRRSAGVSRVVFALVCLSITPTSEGKQPIKSNMQISRSLWHMGMNNAKWFWDPFCLEQGFTCFTSPPFKGQSYRKAAEHHHLFVFGSPNCGGNTRCANSSSRSWSPQKNFTGRFNWKQQNSKATNY